LGRIVGQFNADSDHGSRRQKHPLRRQQRLKRPRGAAWARIVAASLFDKNSALPLVFATR
jgi:hypothetical protein